MNCVNDLCRDVFMENKRMNRFPLATGIIGKRAEQIAGRAAVVATEEATRQQP
jgi:hypothetical protein